MLVPGSSKCDPFGARWGQKPIWLPFSPTDTPCAARALRDLELAHEVPAGKRADTPLFRDSADKPLRRAYTNKLLRLFLAVFMAPEQVKEYTMHSFRAYLCNALVAAGFADDVVQAALRWASPEAIKTYRGTHKDTYAGWLRAAASATFTTCRGRAVLASGADARELPRTDDCEIALRFVEQQAGLLAMAEVEVDGA